MIGPFTNDFLGGMMLGLAIAITSSLGTMLWLLFRPNGLPPADGPTDEPFDPVPNIMKDLDREWEEVNR